jgi:hypothetical protein
MHGMYGPRRRLFLITQQHPEQDQANRAFGGPHVLYEPSRRVRLGYAW